MSETQVSPDIFIPAPSFCIVLGRECGINGTIEVEFGRRTGNYTRDEVQRIVRAHLNRMYARRARYGIAPDAPCVGTFRVVPRKDGRYAIEIL